MKEIEHKFLVDHNKWELIEKSTPQLIVQGYISKSEEKKNYRELELLL